MRQEIEARIKKLERAVGHGLWGMAIFLMVSVAAFNQFSFLPDMSESMRKLLGAPPPVEMISLALVVYAFSGIVMILARMTRNTQSYRGIMHAAFFSGFYLFYHLSHALQDNFWAVFFAGISVLGLENFYLWSRSRSSIRKEQERLEAIIAGKPVMMDDDEDLW